MSAASLRARYLGDAVATSSPQQVLVMLYDRLALDLERAQKAAAAGEREAASDQLQHAQSIVIELLSSLQVDAWEGGPRLAALYNWLISELMQANTKLDTNRISSCRQVVEPLRDAWRRAAAKLAGSPS
jgi:flagellar secretion chaperone FliS